MDDSGAPSRPADRGRARRRVWPRIVLGLLVVVVALGGVMAWQAWSAARSAREGNEAVLSFRARLLDRDTAGARSAMRRAQEATRDARSALSGPQWVLAGSLPLVGDDVDAARRLSSTVDDVTQHALPAVTAAVAEVDLRRLGLRDGRIELAPLRRASVDLDRADVLLAKADEQASGIGTRGLTSSLRSKVEQTQGLLDRSARLARNVAIAGRLLPDMLAEGGHRDYLVLAQNSAEQRSLGGIPGAVVLLRARDGRLSLVKQASLEDIGSFDRPVLPLSDAEQALYGRELGLYPANVTDTPDFPRAARLMAAMWERRQGGRLDGVASLDPWALQLLLRVVGPVTTDAGRLTGDNATQRLLVDLYRDVPDPEKQNEVFAQAARQVFDRVRSFSGDPRALTSALAEGTEEGRVMVWSAHRSEQALLATTPLARTLQDPTPRTSPQFGVYLHDRTQSKMSTYQRVRIAVTPARCGTTTSARMTVRLQSVAPADRDLPDYVTGGGSRVRRGNILTQVVLYAPRGWAITQVSSSDRRRDLVTYKHDGLWAGARDFELAPGQTKTLSVTMAGIRLSSEEDRQIHAGHQAC